MSLSVAAIHPPSAIYREEQRFGWWVYALLALLIALAWFLILSRAPAGPMAPGRLIPDWIATIMVVPVVLLLGVLRMTTVVTPTDVRVWFGWIPTYRRSVPIGTVARVEIVQYRPLADYGGWGIRCGRDYERVYNARGNRGVRLHLVDGSKILIGSQRSEELALAVEGARRPGI